MRRRIGKVIYDFEMEASLHPKLQFLGMSLFWTKNKVKSLLSLWYCACKEMMMKKKTRNESMNESMKEGRKNMTAHGAINGLV